MDVQKIDFRIGLILGYVDAYVNDLDLVFASNAITECFGDDFDFVKLNAVIDSFRLSQDFTILLNDYKNILPPYLYKAILLFFSRDSSILFDFEEREPLLVNNKYLDYAAYYLVYYSNDVKAILFWPASNRCQHKNDSIEMVYNQSNVLYRKDVVFSWDQLYQLMAFVYDGLHWMNCANEQFSAICEKCYYCYKLRSPTTILFVSNYSTDRLRVLKNQLRQMMAIDFSSCHSTDNHNETLTLARFTLNENGINFLKKANLASSAKTIDECKKVKLSTIKSNQMFSFSALKPFYKKTNEVQIFEISPNKRCFDKEIYVYNVPFEYERTNKYFIKKPYKRHLLKFILNKIKNKLLKTNNKL